jgi:hypothetical protein
LGFNVRDDRVIRVEHNRRTCRDGNRVNACSTVDAVVRISSRRGVVDRIVACTCSDGVNTFTTGEDTDWIK